MNKFNKIYNKIITENFNLKNPLPVEKKIQEYIKNGSQGNLDLTGTKIVFLPDNLKINGNLNLKGTPISFLPKGLHVKGNLNILWTKISPSSLPKDLKVDGEIIDDYHLIKLLQSPPN